ncbi:MAG: helix-turn-helix domain-containing protein [Proteobacteria bacterium]|jgi:transcriptional regulator with XRE-family HTH domain|nr:helix-turn-helix domain-containing protein [Pseudomonadota bacterium]
MKTEEPDYDVLLLVGRRIAELRRGRGLTQERLAEKANFSLKYLQRIERGRENLTVTSLAKLADLFTTEIADLFKPPASMEILTGRPKSASPTQGKAQRKTASRSKPKKRSSQKTRRRLSG